MTSGGVRLASIEQMVSSNEDRNWCVYIHINKINNKAYIGITSQLPEIRWGNSGIGYRENKQPVFYRAIQKYGWDNFEHIIWAKNLLEKDAKALEIRLIALFKTNCNRYKNPSYGYNMTDGGEGTSGKVMSENTKQKIGEQARIRYKVPENHPMFGKHLSEEAIDIIRHKAKERYNNPEDNPMFGKHHSESTRKKMSKSKKGKPIGPFSEEHKKKIGESNRGKIRSEEVCKKQSERFKELFKDPKNNPRYGKGRHVVQLSLNVEYIAEYISATEAQKITGINASSISGCCKHDDGRKTAGGFRWMFKEDYELLINDCKGEI